MSEPRVLSHVARVVRLSDAERQAKRELAEANLTHDMNSDELYYWDAEISNDLLDSHYTRMSLSTLKNYTEDAERGVAFLKGHDWRQLPIGYSFDASFEEDGKKRVIASFYTDPTIPEAGDLIRRMKVGLLRDVSVGFHGGRAICDLCGQEFWDCRHFPGLKYEEKKGDTVVSQLATFTIEDARLSEVSGVFDGSTPEAMILKAERAAKNGDLTQQQVRLLENRYRIALPTSRSFPVATPKEESMDYEKVVNDIRSALSLKEEDDVMQRVTHLQSEVQRLTPLAKDGEQYRSDMVEEALAEGVRAQGNDFNRSLYEETFKGASLNFIRQMRDDWRKVANASLASGRQTQEADERKVVADSDIPEEYYA